VALAFRGRRVFGDNKTWRGALVMSCGALAATCALFRVPGYRARLPAPLREASPVALGAVLGVSVVVGELPNSFVKRQLGVAPGARRSLALTVFDQADFVVAAWLLLLPPYRMRAREAAESFAVAAAVDVPINVIGRLVGARSSAL
jgi:hypothetical protein